MRTLSAIHASILELWWVLVYFSSFECSYDLIGLSAEKFPQRLGGGAVGALSAQPSAAATGAAGWIG